MQPAVGCLLVASPQLVDPHFQQTIVYLLEVGPTGCMGLIINRPSTWTIDQIWPDCPDVLTDQRIACEGGPVDTNRGMFIHNGDHLPATHRLAPGLALGGDLTAILRGGGRGRLFLGHAGWDAEQLETEIRQGYWLLRFGNPDLLLSPTLDVTAWEALVQTAPPLEAPSVN